MNAKVKMFDGGMTHTVTFANPAQISIENCSATSVRLQVLPRLEKERTNGWLPARSVNIILLNRCMQCKKKKAVKIKVH